MIPGKFIWNCMMLCASYMLLLTPQCVQGAGVVLELNDGNFKDLTESDGDVWMVKFQAPWCGHCKKLAPVFDQLALKVPDTVHLGSVDVTYSRKIANEHDVKKFPTVKFYRNGHWGKYEGLRTLEDMSEFISRLLEPATKTIVSLDELASLSVSFLLELPSDKPSAKIVSNFEDAVMKLHGRVLIFLRETVDANDTSVSEIETFILTNNRPLVSKLDNSNFKALGDLGLVMMIAVVDYNSPDTQSLIEKLSNAAANMPLIIQDKIIFGHVDGIKWKKFMAHYNTVVNSILCLHSIEDTYINLKATITHEELLEIGNQIATNTLELQLAIQKSFLQKLWGKLVEFYPTSLLCVVPFILLALSFFIPTEAKKEFIGKKD